LDLGINSGIDDIYGVLELGLEILDIFLGFEIVLRILGEVLVLWVLIE
jgi:hypothetical protein